MKAFKREWASSLWVSEDRTAVWAGLVLFGALFIWRLCT